MLLVFMLHTRMLIKTQCEASGYKLKFHDSNKLLPGSLKKLGETFEVETTKGTFPHKFMDSQCEA